MDSSLRLLDFRHCDGSNLYLTKAESSSEIKWIEEDELPKGMDEEMFIVRKRRGDLAKRRIFGKSVQEVKPRKWIITKTVEVTKVDESDSSSASSSDELKVTGAISDMRSRDKELPLSTGLASPNTKQAGILSSLSLSVGCRALRKLRPLFRTSDEFDLNELFVNLLYHSLPDLALSLKHFMDLMWTSVITSEDLPDREKLLESIYHMVHSCTDILGLKTLEEFVSETTTELGCLDSCSSAILKRFCDLFVERRQREVVMTDEEMSHVELKIDPLDVAIPQSTRVPFQYVAVGETELDDAGIIELVYKLYELRNPDKMADVPGIIEKYKLQLTSLFGILLNKYSVDYFADLNDSRVFVSIEKKRETLTAKLCHLFLTFEPSRVCDLAEIVAFWAPKPTPEVAQYVARLEDAYYGHACRPVDSTSSKSAEGSFGTLIKEALAVGNPDVLPRVSAVLKKYAGKEHLLYLAVCDKYGLPVDEARYRAAATEREARLAAIERSRMREILTQIYVKHNPSKIGELDKLIDKLGARALFDLVTKKYKISLVEKIQIHVPQDSALLAPIAAAIGLIVELELANAGGIVHAAIPSSFLAPLECPQGDNLVAESVIRVRDEDESRLRDWVESRLPAKHTHVTAQEPEYLECDSFLVTEHSRASCVVTGKFNPAALGEYLSSLNCGAARMHTILAGKTLTVFVGDFRVAVPNVSSAYRSRLTVWATPLVAQRPTELIAKLMRWPKWLRQCACLFVDQHAQTVSLVGSAAHKTAYSRGIDFLTTMFGPSYLSMVVPKQLCESSAAPPVHQLTPQLYEWSDASFHESGDDLPDEVSGEVGELARPLRLGRQAMRDSYLQGQLCLNCDDTTHKPTECLLKRKVCWNCHGSHSGSACVFPCRFCKGKHAFGILECVKKAAKRIADWGKSGTFLEQKSLTAMARSDLKTPEIMRSLVSMGMDLVLATQGGTNLGGKGFAGLDGIGSIPSELCPPIPDSRYKWNERFFLDDCVNPNLVGRDILRLITAQYSSAIKQVESKEGCKIIFKGASAKELFAGGVAAPADLRFHAVILCDSAQHAGRVKKFLWETIENIESGLNEGRIPKPPIVEGFAYLEKVHGLQENLFQYDYLNFSSASGVLELDLKNRFEFVGDLRHWLHRQGVEVHLGDDGVVGVPSTAKIEAVLAEREITHQIGKFVDVFNAFFELVTFWTNTHPCFGGAYWFEPFELEPVGLLHLATNTASSESFESGQVVRLSAVGAQHFARLLRTAEYTKEPEEEVVHSLMALRGVVRAIARDARLLMYLKHPWALSSSTGTVARDVPESFTGIPLTEELNAEELRKCGRLGRAPSSMAMDCIDQDAERTRKAANSFVMEQRVIGSKTIRAGDALLSRLSTVPETELPYVGYIVDWATPKEVTEYLSGAGPALDEEPTEAAPDLMDIVPEAVAQDVEEKIDLNSLSVSELRDKLRTKDLPLTGRKVDLIERLQADLRGNTPVTTYKCRVELPKALMKWSDFVNNIAGPSDSHFNHIKQQCPSVTLACLGSASAALVGEARLHVQITATDLPDFKKAKSLVEDLVRAVVDVGIDACLSDDTQAVRTATMKDVKVISITEQSS